MIFKEILLCKPKYFDVIHYKLNAHMIMKNKVNYNLALQQWRCLEENLLNNNVKINYIKPRKNLVDMVFSANGGIIFENKAIVSNFRAIPRKNEAKYYANYFENNGYETFPMITEFEGAGDGLFSHNNSQLWIGHGFRTDIDCKNEIEDIISNNYLDINTLKLVNPNWYHLDTCFCPFGDNNLLIYEGAFDKQSLKKIYNVYNEKDCIKVSYEDAMNFACNSISVPNNIIIGHCFSDNLKSKLKDINYNTIENNMSQFLLSGGSTKCCVLDIEKKGINIGGELQYNNNDNNNNIYYHKMLSSQGDKYMPDFI